MPIPNDLQKDFYYFILDCEYINPQTTRLRVQLDVWQTYVYDVTIGNCYVERGHIGIANTNQFNNYGRDYLTVPEGLDIGNEYRIIAKRTEEIVSLSTTTLQYEHDVIVVSSTDLLADPGTIVDPSLKTPHGSNIQGLPSGAAFYVFPTVNDFTFWLSQMSDYPWITQGIISISILPKITRYNPVFEYDADSSLPQFLMTLQAYPKKHKMLPNWRNSSEIINWIDPKYRHLKKFFTTPYMVLEATTWSATPVILRPEVWNSADADMLERVNYMPPNQRVQLTPRSYNSDGREPEAISGMTNAEYSSFLDGIPGMTPELKTFLYDLQSSTGDDFGDYLDMMTQIAGFPALPVVNSMALSYLASNASGIQHQRNSAGWTQQRALGSASASYNIATSGIATSENVTQVAQQTARNQAVSQNANIVGQASIGALGGFASGTIGGIPGGPVGATAGGLSATANGVTSIINAGVQAQHNSEAAAISNLGLGQTNSLQNQQSAMSRDTNRDLAQFASKGDYANTIAGINAMVQDAEMIQPSMSGQFGGDATNIANGTMEFSIRWKFIDAAAMRVIGDYWLRFGYAIRAFIKPPQSLMVMTKFTYWKMTEAYISSSMVPEGHKQVLRGIMEKGFTVWVNPADIGVVDFADNAPLPGVSY
jgi:hypothetical protein